MAQPKLTSSFELADYQPGEYVHELRVTIVKLFKAKNTANSRMCRAIVANGEGWVSVLTGWKHDADVMEQSLHVHDIFLVKMAKSVPLYANNNREITASYELVWDKATTAELLLKVMKPELPTHYFDAEGFKGVQALDSNITGRVTLTSTFVNLGNGGHARVKDFEGIRGQLFVKTWADVLKTFTVGREIVIEGAFARKSFDSTVLEIKDVSQITEY